jgi:hypothetical protein
MNRASSISYRLLFSLALMANALIAAAAVLALFRVLRPTASFSWASIWLLSFALVSVWSLWKPHVSSVYWISIALNLVMIAAAATALVLHFWREYFRVSVVTTASSIATGLLLSVCLLTLSAVILGRARLDKSRQA